MIKERIKKWFEEHFNQIVITAIWILIFISSVLMIYGAYKGCIK